jgi:hypothetical protein
MFEEKPREVRCRTCTERRIGCRWEKGEDTVREARKRRRVESQGPNKRRRVEKSDEEEGEDGNEAPSRPKPNPAQKTDKGKGKATASAVPGRTVRILDPNSKANEDSDEKINVDLRRFFAASLVQQDETKQYLARIAIALERLQETQRLYLEAKIRWHGDDESVLSSSSSSDPGTDPQDDDFDFGDVDGAEPEEAGENPPGEDDVDDDKTIVGDGGVDMGEE